MVTQRDYINIDPSTADRINQAVFICDAATPLAICPFQCFRFTDAREWMQLNVFKQVPNTLQNTLVTDTFPILKVDIGLWKKDYFHISSNVTTRPRPFLMSSSPWRRISTIAGDDMIYSVSSIACFLAESFLRYFKAFCIRLSSSAMILSSRKSSAFICSAVIILSFFCFTPQKYI